MTQINSLTKILLIVLRLAIGWHLFYEGATKLHQQYLADPPKPFSAEGYLRNSQGPFRTVFRNMIDDVFGIQQLDPDMVRERWVDRVNSGLYELNTDQKEEVIAYIEGPLMKGEFNDQGQKTAPGLIDDMKYEQAKIDQYKADIAKWEARDNQSLSERELEEHLKKARALNTTRRELLAPVVKRTKLLEAKLDAMNQGPPSQWQKLSLGGQLDHANFFTMWGLTICGALMLLGLFSRLAALGGACLLMMFYLSMPPFPGTIAPPNTEGTYLFVNKNLIELFACLVLASVPTGVWGGLDALIRGLITRPLFGVGKDEVLVDADDAPPPESPAKPQADQSQAQA